MSGVDRSPPPAREGVDRSCRPAREGVSTAALPVSSGLRDLGSGQGPAGRLPVAGLDPIGWVALMNEPSDCWPNQGGMLIRIIRVGAN